MSAPRTTETAIKEALAETIEQWVNDSIEAGQPVPDFWAELNVSELLAEHLVQLGWHR